MDAPLPSLETPHRVDQPPHRLEVTPRRTVLQPEDLLQRRALVERIKSALQPIGSLGSREVIATTSRAQQHDPQIAHPAGDCKCPLLTTPPPTRPDRLAPRTRIGCVPRIRSELVASDRRSRSHRDDRQPAGPAHRTGGRRLVKTHRRRQPARGHRRRPDHLFGRTAGGGNRAGHTAEPVVATLHPVDAGHQRGLAPLSVAGPLMADTDSGTRLALAADERRRQHGRRPQPGAGTRRRRAQ